MFNNIFRFQLEKSPQPFGLFHLVFIFLILVISYVIITRYNKQSNKQIDRFLLISGIILVVIEIIKQWLLIDNNGGKYPWSAFPFQFCSTPMYLYLISPLVKNKNAKKAIYAFIGCFGIIGGLSVILTGQGVMATYLWQNFHTMIWHGLLVICGVYVLVNYSFIDSYEEILGGILILIGVFLIADLGNFIGYFIMGPTDLNLFFISPFVGCDNYILTGWLFTSTHAQNIINHNVGWSDFVFMHISYLVLFIFGGGIVFSLTNLFKGDVKIIDDGIFELLENMTLVDSLNPFRIFI